MAFGLLEGSLPFRVLVLNLGWRLEAGICKQT